MTAARWWGLAGAGLLAGGGWLVGAGPGPAPTGRTEVLWGHTLGLRFGLLAYLIGLALLAGAWWRLGRHLSARSAPDAGVGRGRAGSGSAGRVRWLLVTGALWAAPLLVTAPLGSRDVYSYACQGAVWLAGHHPYQAGPAAGGCPWLTSVSPLWHDTPAPYGPVALLISAGVVAVAQLIGTGDAATLLFSLAGLRLVAVVGVLLLAVAGPKLARACRVDPAGAAWLGLVTPLVVVHAVAGGHHDAFVAGLLVAGLALAVPTGALAGATGAAGRVGPAGWRGVAGRAGVAGVAGALAGALLGLAVAVKVTALAALPFAWLLAGRRWAAGALVAGTVASFGGVTAASGLGFGWLAALQGTGALAQWSSLPSAAGMTAGYILRALGAPEAYPTAVTVAQLAGLAGLVVLAAVMFGQAWRRVGEPRAVVVRAGVVLAAVVLLGPVVYPWYALAPLAVLAASVTAPRIRSGLAAATVVLTALTLPSGLGVPSVTKFPGAILVTVLMGLAAGWGLRRWWRARPAGRGPGGRSAGQEAGQEAG